MRETHTAPDCADTLDDLVRQGGVALDLDLGELALVGTCLDDAVVTTSNSVATVEERGGYAALQRCGDRFRVNPRRVSMRVAHWRAPPVMLTSGAAGGPALLSIPAPDGRIQHRIQIARADWHHVAAIPLAQVQNFPMSRQPPKTNVVSLAEVRQRRAAWPHMTTGEVIDDILHDCGAARLATLRAMGAYARRVRPELLPSFLTFLSDRCAEMDVTVLADGMAQTLSGGQFAAVCRGNTVTCRSDRGHVSMDLGRLGEVWISRTCCDTRLEIYAKDGTCAAVLHRLGCQNFASYLGAYPSVYAVTPG